MQIRIQLTELTEGRQFRSTNEVQPSTIGIFVERWVCVYNNTIFIRIAVRFICIPVLKRVPCSYFIVCPSVLSICFQVVEADPYIVPSTATNIEYLLHAECKLFTSFDLHEIGK